MVSELLLNRGKAYSLFGETELAARWITEAKAHSEEHGNNQISFQADEALTALEAGELATEDSGAAAEPITIEDIDVVCSELSSLRSQLVSTAEPGRT
jgi:hypothetical protein